MARSRNPANYPALFIQRMGEAINNEVVIPAASEDMARSLVATVNAYRRSTREWEVEGWKEINEVEANVYDSMDVLNARPGHFIDCERFPISVVLRQRSAITASMKHAKVSEEKEPEIILPESEEESPESIFDMNPEDFGL